MDDFEASFKEPEPIQHRTAEGAWEAIVAAIAEFESGQNARIADPHAESDFLTRRRRMWCDYLDIRPESRTARHHFGQLDKLAEILETSDERVNECMMVLMSPDKDVNPNHWKHYANPYADSFINDLGVLVDSATDYNSEPVDHASQLSPEILRELRGKR
jgi:hypothetical protein